MKNNKFYNNYISWREYGKNNHNYLRVTLTNIYYWLVNKGFIIPRIVKLIDVDDKNSRIIDLGCGDGKILDLLALCGYKNLTGIDIQDIAINKKQLSYNFEKIDVISYLSKLEPVSVNFFILTDVLEHMSQDDALKLLQEVNRTLKKDGAFIIRVPNMSSFMGLQVAYGDLTHKIFFNMSSLNQILLECKFDKFYYIKVILG